MQPGPKIAEVAALVGDPARANMLTALVGGGALTASELAYAAHVTPQTASSHLSRLAEAGVLAVHQQGRHRYYRLASPLVGQMLEVIMAVAEAGPDHYRPHWKGGDDLRTARTCYDHLAGRLAVAITDALVSRGHIILTDDGGEVTSLGQVFLGDLGLDVPTLVKQRRVFCRPCLDWSERRPHLAGAVGAGLATRIFDLGWVRRIKDSRALLLTPDGRRCLKEVFGAEIE